MRSDEAGAWGGSLRASAAEVESVFARRVATAAHASRAIGPLSCWRLSLTAAVSHCDARGDHVLSIGWFDQVHL